MSMQSVQANRVGEALVKTSACDGVAARAPFRHRIQKFTWLTSSWDIARLQRDMDAGRLQPKIETVNRDFIESYAVKVLGLPKELDLERKRASLWMHVDVAAAMALPACALDDPVILLQTRKKGGLLRLDGRETADHVLGDGQHRVARAFYDNVQSLPVVILSGAQSNRYRLR